MKTPSTGFAISREDLGLGLYINRDWRVLCVFLLFVLVAVFVLDLFFFYEVDVAGGGETISQTGPLSDFDISKLNSVMTSWEVRVKEFNIRAEVTPKIIDPSL